MGVADASGNAHPIPAAQLRVGVDNFVEVVRVIEVIGAILTGIIWKSELRVGVDIFVDIGRAWTRARSAISISSEQWRGICRVHVNSIIAG